ncbi:uncharacterized protein B0T15DRAFT_540968 [Chaetomium strumarium]|uniref:DUF7580 domain-containing protein n=1 Tax=Chaetomium strumarium TaxID=1170767 RepID=A0AAJ0GPA9_9PEZI|nr:hypothetical protein B0T15DRAFT_540968 [Chaetomium strumarium]
MFGCATENRFLVGADDPAPSHSCVCNNIATPLRILSSVLARCCEITMSGIEVAGLVLGAFPIAIWALERYRDVARVMGFWYEIRLEYQRSISELKYHRLSFVRNLKQLLLPLVQDDAQLQRLINDPAGDSWKDVELQTALEWRLKDAYGLYLEILSEMQRVMQELNEELAIESEAVQSKVHETKGPKSKIPTATKLRQSFDRSNRAYQTFRVKFSLGAPRRTQLFADLQKHNDRLEKLMTSSDVVSGLEDNRQQQLASSRSTNTALSKFWSQADKVYKAFITAFNCSCRDYHCAQLILQHREPVDKDFCLRLDSGVKESNPNTSWEMFPLALKVPGPQLHNATTEALVIQNDMRTSLPISAPPGWSNMPKETALSAVGKKRKTVRVLESHGVTLTQTQTLTIHTKACEAVTVHTTPAPTPQESPITNLCQTLGYSHRTISKVPDSLPSIGYLELEDDDTRYYIYPDSSLAPSQTHISLGQIILGEIKPPLTRRQRYRLSLTLASSFVQLKDTAWLQTPWEKGGVFFSLNAEGGTPRLDQPFIVSRFDGVDPKIKQTPHSGGTTGTISSRATGHDVAGIACLGVLLLELCFGRPIESHPSRIAFPDGERMDQHTRAALDLIAALEWLKEVNDEAGADYTDAVEWCLAGCRTLPSDGSWRRQMMQKVIEPLERCYRYLG